MNRLFRGASRAAIALALTAPAAAVAGTITGTVLDGTGTRALQSTQLRIVELGRVAEAGRDGSYRFPDVAPGTYTIEARYVGADAVRKSVTVPVTGDAQADIRNDQGEGRFVSVRGLDPALNAASINGTRIPAPESDTRQVALDVIPSELIESIEIKKSLTPDMDADTIGASIGT